MEKDIAKAGRKGHRLEHKGLIFAYFILVVIMLAGNAVPLGYSSQNNMPVYVDLTAGNVQNEKKISTRNYSESYTLSITDNIAFQSCQIFYSAEDEHFKGVINAKLVGEDGVIASTSAQMGATGSGGTYKAVDLFFYVNAAKRYIAQLQKDHNYTLQLQVDTNMPGYYFQEVEFSTQQDTLCKLTDDEGIVANICYTPSSLMRNWDAFYGIIFLVVIVGGWYVLSKFGIVPLKNPVAGRTGAFIREHYSEILLVLMFLFLAIYEFFFAYVKGTYISPDSSAYLREADAILNGYGFNEIGKTGYSSWFVGYAIGYPTLIAAVAFVTGRNVYLASKILAVLIVGLFLLLLYVRFRKDAWIYSFCLLNIGFLYIYKYTWSEIPFILGLLTFCLILEQIIKNEEVKMRWFILWGLSGAFVTVCRYFGAFSLIAMAIVFIFYLCVYFLHAKDRNRTFRGKIVGCMVSGIIAGVITGSYLISNYIHAGSFTGNRDVWWDDYSTLTNEFYSAIVRELCNALRIAIPDTVAYIMRDYQMWIAVVFLLAVIYLLAKFKPKDFRAVFIGVGLFYYAVFTIIRYHSSMDTFGPRFFAPASMLITIGLLGFLAPLLKRHRNGIAPIIISVLALLTTGLSFNLKDLNKDETAYAELVKTLSAQTEAVPPCSAVLNYDLDYQTRVVRPDIFETYSGINPGDTMSDLFERYSKSDYICVKAKNIKNILFYPIYDYDESVSDFFRDAVTEDTPDEEFVVISVKEQKLQ